MRKDLFYRDGSVLHVNSNLREELLATRLERERLVTGLQVDESLKRSKSLDIQLGQALIEAGAITAEQLQGALQRQLDDRFVELLSWRRGSFTFYEEVAFPAFAEGKRIEGLSLMGRAIRTHYATAELEALFEPYLSWQVIGVPSPIVGPDAVGLEADAAALVGRLGGGRTVAKLLADASGGSERASLLRALFVLQQADIVRLSAPS